MRELVRDLSLALRERVLLSLGVLEEAGAVVSDAYGAQLGANPLLGSGEEFQMSVVASANEALHERILTAIDAGIRRLSG